MTRVLVVDDDQAIVELVSMALEDEGYEVVSAVNGAAVEMARTHHPDVILLDLMMPVMDGFEVSRRLRSSPTTAIIPIIAMSAQARLTAARDILPVDDRLAKPFDLQDLFAKVAQFASP